MDTKKIYIASDHAGFAQKALSHSILKDMGFEVVDLGPQSAERTDYPDWADEVCLQLQKDPHSQGVLMCGSGQGMAMRANKYPFIRAALCWDKDSATLAREHNDANVLCFGARLIDEKTILEILKAFFSTSFEGGRHKARVDKIANPIE